MKTQDGGYTHLIRPLKEELLRCKYVNFLKLGHLCSRNRQLFFKLMPYD